MFVGVEVEIICPHCLISVKSRNPYKKGGELVGWEQEREVTRDLEKGQKGFQVSRAQLRLEIENLASRRY